MAPLLWAIPASLAGRETLDLVVRLGNLEKVGAAVDDSLAPVLRSWLSSAATAGQQEAYGLESLAWCHALPRLARRVPAILWWRLVEHLIETAKDAAAIDREASPLAHQWLAGELPLTLAYLLPEIEPCRKLARGARRALSEGMATLLDGKGLPRAEHLHLLRPLLACWTRCRAMGEQLKRSCWNRSAETQFAHVVRNALRLARPDGTAMLSGGSAADGDRALFAAALGLPAARRARAVADRVLPGRGGDRRLQKKRLKRPSPANHSEWAETAILRRAWTPDSQRLAVAYDHCATRAELVSGRDVLWSGLWDLEVRVSGVAARAESAWESVLWVSDSDVDYLELEINLTGPLKVQRQIMLARRDRLLFLADAILGSQPQPLDYRATLPLAAGISFQLAHETNDGILAGAKTRAAVLPLALPEWRGAADAGRLVQTERGLELTQSATGRCLFAPLVIDLDPRRRGEPVTWRQLTVAEDRVVQPAETAVGYRVQIGKRQWLVYRSLARQGNRTLLGHNLSTAFVLGRFSRRGEVDPLLEIE
ncbi:MAG: hypothetical protein ACYC35_09280 [Pirellulales bacterium]